METSINLNPKIIMLNNEKQLKKLPCGATKRQIFKMYPKESDAKVRRNMHHALRDCNPHEPENKIIRGHRLSFKEFQRFIEFMGVPPGYTEEYNY